VSTWLVPRQDLTPEQLRAVGLPHDRHQVIFGAPGSGKTLVLLYRARELCDQLGTPPDRFRIFVFTNVLKEYIRSALNLLQLPDGVVTTYDAWCAELHENQIGPLPLRQHGWNSKPDYPEIRRRVACWVRRHCASMPLYDFVMVDEGQDLEPEVYEVLRHIASHVTVCLDDKQQIYERGSRKDEILLALGLHHRNLTLLGAYRCSPLVARLAAQFLTSEEERRRYLNQIRVAQTDRETPVLYLAHSFEDERQQLIAALRQRLLKDRRIAVLFPLRRQVREFAQSLRAAGIEVDEQPELDFSSDAPKLMTYHSAKGLTFESVFLPQLVWKSFKNKSENNIRHLLFVAVTRATQWVYMSGGQYDGIGVLKDLALLKQQGVLKLLRGRFEDEPHPPEPASDLQGNDLDFL